MGVCSLDGESHVPHGWVNGVPRKERPFPTYSGWTLRVNRITHFISPQLNNYKYEWLRIVNSQEVKMYMAFNEALIRERGQNLTTRLYNDKSSIMLLRLLLVMKTLWLDRWINCFLVEN